MWNLERDPFLRYSSPRHADIVADGFVRFLWSAGLDAFSMAALARWMKVTPSAVAQRARKPETVGLIVQAMAERWLRWSAPRWVPDGELPALLPVTEAEALGVRAWVLAGELARSRAAAGDEEPAAAVVRALAADRAQHERCWRESQSDAEREGEGGGRGDFEELWVTLQGLRLALAFGAQSEPALVAAAERVLARSLNI